MYAHAKCGWAGCPTAIAIREERKRDYVFKNLFADINTLITFSI